MSCLYVDTSALVRRYVHAPGRDLVIGAMDGPQAWCTSALTRTEVLLALAQVALHPPQQQRLWSELRDEWSAFWVVPVDGRALADAVELGGAYGVPVVDALHLAAAARLPPPVRFLTFERRQIPAATGLGFEVVSPLAI